MSDTQLESVVTQAVQALQSFGIEGVPGRSINTPYGVILLEQSQNYEGRPFIKATPERNLHGDNQPSAEGRRTPWTALTPGMSQKRMEYEILLLALTMLSTQLGERRTEHEQDELNRQLVRRESIRIMEAVTSSKAIKSVNTEVGRVTIAYDKGGYGNVLITPDAKAVQPVVYLGAYSKTKNLHDIMIMVERMRAEL